MSATSSHGTRVEAFCPSCGAERDRDAGYCERCGHRFANGSADVATAQLRVAQPDGLVAAAPQPGNTGQRTTLPWLPILGVVVVIAAAAVAVVLLLSGGESTSSYQQQLTSQVTKVTAADDALATELERLRPGGSSGSSLAAANAAAGATHDTQVALDVLTTPGDRQSLHAETDAALASQDAYLVGVTAALRNPSEATAADLTPLASNARDHWAGLAVLCASPKSRLA